MNVYVTQNELEAALEDVLNKLENDNDNIDVVYVPPEVHELTDEEHIDEDALTDEYLPNKQQEIAGTFEIQIHNTNKDSDDDFDSSDDETLQAKRQKLNTRPKGLVPVWKKGETIYENLPIFDSACRDNIQNNLGGKSPLELFLRFFDDEVLTTIVNYSVKYAHDNNRHNFQLGIKDLKRFLGILLLSGYHRLPQSDLYWSKDEDKGLDIVRNCMSRNRFRSIKRNLHLSDNANLRKDDKFAKLRPIFNIMNIKYMQFGVFAHDLSIDEQMVPYFGRHSCKMFIKCKPVRFGFKIWCLSSSDGYLFQFAPYGGAKTSKEKSELGLGGQVVVDLLKIVKNPQNHRIYFDNFFSSYKLLKFLNENGFYATGTIRDNRTAKCPLESIKVIAKKERGSYDSVFDEETKISLIRWNDNSVVTVISNNFTVEPSSTARRYKRTERKDIMIFQPNVIAQYNRHMGGVDLHDNGVSNYRINVRGKKWWWPLFVNLLDSAVVNCWKLFNMANENKMSLLDFKSYIAVRLMKAEDDNADNKNSTNRSYGDSVPKEVRVDNVGHVIREGANKARRRCKLCGSHTIYICAKCKVHLHPKCFEDYHK